jgi:dephospho-CoA kinase
VRVQAVGWRRRAERWAWSGPHALILSEPLRWQLQGQAQQPIEKGGQQQSRCEPGDTVQPGSACRGRAASGRKPIIGLAGAIGAGKSEVGREMGRMGARVVDSDALAQQELDAPEVKELLVEYFGGAVVSPDGAVSRRKLADLVFGDPAARLRVERVVHPRVARRRAEAIEAAQADASVQAIVVDSPLLFEVGLDLLCDAVVFVEAPEAARLARVGRLRGWDRAEVERREKWQKGLDFKRERSDYIIDNGSNIEALRQQASRVFSAILSSVTSQSTIQGGRSGMDPGVAGGS